MKTRICKKLEKFGVIADVDLDVIGEDIEFDYIEYTNFINENYKPFAGNWIRISDDRIICNPTEILEDFVNSKNCDHDFVIKFGEYYCQECGVSHEEAIKPNWKNCPKCEFKGTYGQMITEEWFCTNCHHRGLF